MIRLGKNALCEDCEYFKGVKQPKGNESEEYFYCVQYNKIPTKIVLGEKCKKAKI